MHPLTRRWLLVCVALVVAWVGGLWAVRALDDGGWRRALAWAVLVGGVLGVGASLVLYWLTLFPGTWHWRW